MRFRFHKTFLSSMVLFTAFSLMGCIKGGNDFSEEEESSSKSIQSNSITNLSFTTTTTTTTTTTSVPSTPLASVQANSSDLSLFIKSIDAQYSVSTGGILISPVEIKFNRTMNVASVNQAVSMSIGGVAVELTALTSGTTADTFLFQPTTNLQLASQYLFTINTNARDSQGNSLPSNAEVLLTTRSINVSFLPLNTNLFKIGNAMCCLTGITLDTQLNTNDLMVSGDGNVVRFQNDGSGNFTANTIKSSETSALFSSMLKADVDRDDLEDLVLVLNAGNNVVNVISLLNQRDINASTPFSWGSNKKTSSLSGISQLGNFLKFADVNNDGNTDIAFSDQGGTQPRLLVLGGVRTGEFALISEISLKSGAIPSDFSFIDYNQDGNEDIIVLSNVAKTLVLFYGDGKGNFTEVTNNLTSLLTGTSPNQIIALDFNSDSYPDIAISDLANKQIILLRNEKTGSFKLLNQITTGNSPGSITSGYFNNDNFLDVAIANVGDDEVSILLGDGSGGFTKKEDVATIDQIQKLSTVNLNNDEIDDLVVMSSGIAGLGLMQGTTKGLFSTRGNLALGDAPSAVVVEDINEDSIDDLIVSNYNDSDLSILIGNGKSGFSRQSDVALATSSKPVDLIIGDFDNDQKNEIVTLNEGNDTLTLMNISDGQLETLFSVSLTGDGPKQGVAGDFNNDGQLDLAIVMETSNQLNILLNIGGGFSEISQITTTVSAKPVSLATGYFNFDTNLDLAVVNQTSQTISIYYGTGTGHFALHQVLTAPTSEQTTTTLLLGNIVTVTREDGFVTLLAVIDQGTPDSSKSPQKNVFLYTNDGDTFSYSSWLTASPTPTHIVALDLHGDQIPELIVTGPSLLSVHTDSGSGGYTTTKTTLTTGSNPQKAAMADLDGDLAPDIILVDQTDDELSIFFQR